MKAKKDPRLVIKTEKGEKEADAKEIDTSYKDRTARTCYYKLSKTGAYIDGIINNVMKDRKTGKDVLLQLPKPGQLVHMETAPLM